MNNLTQSKLFWQILAVGFAALFLVSLFFNFFEFNLKPKSESENKSYSAINNDFDIDEEEIAKLLFPEGGIIIPVSFGNLGKQLTDSGVIDKEQFKALYDQKGGLSDDMQKLLDGTYGGDLAINEDNADVLLNFLWAFGLSNKNPILETGPMRDPQYGGAENFASTGGWTLAKGNAMDHYSKHEFVKLTDEQQDLVKRVSENIYRPCCGNSTYFPDCNHGMAMLGLLEIMASQGLSEEEMYDIALKVNSYWFPSTYMTIAKYLKKQGVEWQDASPKEILGASYSNASGFKRVLSEVEPVNTNSGGGCGV